MTILYSIRKWDEDFENNRTRVLKSLNWVPIPNNHDSDGYTQILEHEDGIAIYGAWITIVQVASKCTPRGVLKRRNGEPHDARSLSRQTRVSVEVYEQAIPFLAETIGWLEVAK